MGYTYPHVFCFCFCFVTCICKGFGDDLVLTTTFPKRVLAASDATCRASTLLSLGLAPSARLTATTAAALASEKVTVETFVDVVTFCTSSVK